MLREIHVMASYWHDDDSLTRAGSLMRAAKDHGDERALEELATELRRFAHGLPLAPGSLVAPVPARPRRENPVVVALAGAVASARSTAPAMVMAAGEPAPRMRDRALEERAALAAAAAYTVVGDVTGRPVVLVDDVVATETTLGHLAGLLVEAGASRVDAVVACRTRRLGQAGRAPRSGSR